MKVVRTVFAAIALFTAVAASSASAQGVNLSGPWQCVAQWSPRQAVSPTLRNMAGTSTS